MERMDINLVHPDERPTPDAYDSPKVVQKLWDYTNWKYRIAQALLPDKMVEIGVRAGYTAFSFYRACPDMIYIGYDLNAGTHGGKIDFTKWAVSKLTELGKTFSITFPFDSQSVDKLPDEALYADVYHIDGDHSINGCLHDLNICKNAMHEHSFLLVDDYKYIRNVKKAVDEFLSKHKYFSSLTLPSVRGDVIIYYGSSKTAEEKIQCLM